jgi:Family of unknown function (DUF6311)
MLQGRLALQRRPNSRDHWQWSTYNEKATSVELLRMGSLQQSSPVVNPLESIEAPVSAVASVNPLTEGRYRWLDAIWFQLLVSAIIGFMFALLVMGSEPVNPRNIDWLGEDGCGYYVAWELLRQDPHWHWPLMYTNRMGYPIGDSVALVDVNPWLALPGKVFSSVLPEPFQYFGIQAAIAYALQLFFALRLFRICQRDNYLGIWTAALFFLIAPPLTFRLKFHYTLANHWLLLAALIVFFQAQQEVPTAVRRFVVSALMLAGIAMATNPYIAFQVVAVLAAALLSLLWKGKITLLHSAGFMAAMGVVCVIVAYVLGFIIPGGKGYGGAGYRIFSMNLLAPFNPSWFGSIIFPSLVPKLERGQYEGYVYLGAGVIVLALIVATVALFQRSKLKVIDKRWAIPLLLCCVCLTLTALTTKVIAGNRVLVDVDPQQVLSRFLAPLRSSGRLFWLPYYTILAALLAAPYLFMRRARANALLACLLVLQFADTAPLRRWVYAGLHEPFPKPLKSPVWHQLGSAYENLIVLPAWQCGARLTPGWVPGDRIFGYLATEQRMAINSYYSARYVKEGMEYHCKNPGTNLLNFPLSPDSAYVITPSLAAQVEQNPTGKGKCHDVDGFILCLPTTDFGLPPRTREQGADATN